MGETMKGFTISDETNPKRKIQKLIERKEHLKTQIEIMRDQIEIMDSVIEELNIETTKKDSVNII
jgi:chaperonin cofactor prefoldin